MKKVEKQKTKKQINFGQEPTNQGGRLKWNSIKHIYLDNKKIFKFINGCVGITYLIAIL